MRNQLLFIFLLTITNTVSGQFSVCENIGYYGGAMADDSLYDLEQKTGASGSRSTIDIGSYLTYHINTYQERLNHASKIGLKNSIFFLNINKVAYAHRSTAIINGVQSWLPQNLDLPTFNNDGSINRNNYWGAYCYDVFDSLQSFGAIYYEIENEPDQTGANPDVDWLSREPFASELTNMNDTIGNYILLCKIAYEVKQKLQPGAKICTGGLGYPQFYKWFLKKGGGKYIDVNSIHFYPYWHWTSNTQNKRNSSYAAFLCDSIVTEFRKIDSGKFQMIMTETNLPRWRYVDSLAQFPNNKLWGSDVCQTNYTLKCISHLANDGLLTMSFYQTGETGDSGLNNGTAKSEIDAMGAYKKLIGVTTEAQAKMTNQGRVILAYTSLLSNYKIDTSDKAREPGVDFSEWDSIGAIKKAYIICAVTTKDTSEVATAVHEFADKGQYDVFDCFGHYLRTCTDTIHLTGAANICKQHQTALALIPPPIVSRNTDTTFEVTVSPNPTKDQIRVRIHTQNNSAVMITIFDVYGTLMNISGHKFITGFTSSLNYDNTIRFNFESGIYFVKINLNSKQVIKKLIVIK